MPSSWNQIRFHSVAVENFIRGRSNDGTMYHREDDRCCETRMRICSHRDHHRSRNLWICQLNMCHRDHSHASWRSQCCSCYAEDECKDPTMTCHSYWSCWRNCSCTALGRISPLDSHGPRNAGASRFRNYTRTTLQNAPLLINTGVESSSLTDFSKFFSLNDSLLFYI